MDIYNKESISFSISSLIVERKYVFIVLNRLNECSHSHKVTGVVAINKSIS